MMETVAKMDRQVNKKVRATIPGLMRACFS